MMCILPVCKEAEKYEISFRTMNGLALNEEPEVLNRCVELWMQLDADEIQRNSKLGLKMKQYSSSDMRNMFKTKLLNTEFLNLVMVNDQIVGMARGFSVTEYENCFFINTLFIDKSFRRKGLGKMLIQFMMEKHPGQKMMLHVSMANTEALLFYKSMGFKPVSQTMVFN